MGHFMLTWIIDISNVSITGHVGQPAYNTFFFIISLSNQPVYDQNLLTPNPNP